MSGNIQDNKSVLNNKEISDINSLVKYVDITNIDDYIKINSFIDNQTNYIYSLKDVNEFFKRLLNLNVNFKELEIETKVFMNNYSLFYIFNNFLSLNYQADDLKNITEILNSLYKLNYNADLLKLISNSIIENITLKINLYSNTNRINSNNDLLDILNELAHLNFKRKNLNNLMLDTFLINLNKESENYNFSEALQLMNALNKLEFKKKEINGIMLNSICNIVNYNHNSTISSKELLNFIEIYNNYNYTRDDLKALKLNKLFENINVEDTNDIEKIKDTFYIMNYEKIDLTNLDLLKKDYVQDYQQYITTSNTNENENSKDQKLELYKIISFKQAEYINAKDFLTSSVNQFISTKEKLSELKSVVFNKFLIDLKEKNEDVLKEMNQEFCIIKK